VPHSWPSTVCVIDSGVQITPQVCHWVTLILQFPLVLVVRCGPMHGRGGAIGNPRRLSEVDLWWPGLVCEQEQLDPGRTSASHSGAREVGTIGLHVSELGHPTSDPLVVVGRILKRVELKHAIADHVVAAIDLCPWTTGNPSVGNSPERYGRPGEVVHVAEVVSQ